MRREEKQKEALMPRVVAMLCFLLCCESAAAQNPYEGKTINIISGASGGYDSYTRLLASHMGKFIPGAPNAVVRNMPGAASMAAANYLYNIASADGLTFGSFVKAIPLAPLLGDQAARYDASKFTWIGSASSYQNDAYLLIVRKDLGINSFADLKNRAAPVRLGSTGPSSDADVGARVVGQTLGLKFKLVRGYQGTPQIALAVESGEMDGMMIGLSSLHTARPKWLEANSPVRFIFQFGYGGEGRFPMFQDTPRIDELAQSDEDRAIFSLMQLPFRVARPFAGPPGMSDSNKKTLRGAFMQAFRDERLLSEARKMGLDVSPVSGEEVADRIRAASALPAALIKRYSDLLASE